MMRRLMMTLVVGASWGCGPAVVCASGEASGVSVKVAGASAPIDHRVCASGGRDGEGFVQMLTLELKTGTMTNLQLSANRLEELANAECSKDVSALLYDDPANRLEYISPNFVSDWRDSPPTSCSITAVRAGERLEGTFSGHLRRLRNDGVTEEYADIAFSFSVVAPRPGT